MSKIMKAKIVSASILLLTPFLTFAATSDFDDFDSIITSLTGWINKLIPFLIGLAVLYFLYNILRYVTQKEQAKREEARDHMIFGIVTIFVMVSVWGLVNILVNTFGLETDDVPEVPALPDEASL